ncbi:DUF2986 domain-containing protein [uncultured Shewanella sp.]|uniref:DUF2986 domain-containing protein n=1 Tax=Shewanella atlantica TaxID=271099 RepID=UPI002630AFD3|nr:DUF2986 domain-containing protein [uncultured Shewanella sp.]
MNKKQKMIKLTAKRAKARKNKHTAPTIKKYVSKGDRAKALAQEQARAALESKAGEAQNESQNPEAALPETAQAEEK